jgi:hypothetical protein
MKFFHHAAPWRLVGRAPVKTAVLWIAGTVIKLRNAPMFLLNRCPTQDEVQKLNQSRILAEKFCHVENFLDGKFFCARYSLPNRTRCQVPRL